MTETQVVGQVLMVGVPIDDPDSAVAELEQFPVGGVFLDGHSTVSTSTIRSSVDELRNDISAVDGAPIHVSVDEEGGQVQSVRGDGFPVIPSAVEQGRMRTVKLRSTTTTWAEDLRAAGVTLDLAPVADTVPGVPSDNPPIGAFDRQYGSTPDAVASSVVTVMTAMQNAHLGATVKHFPGLGRVKANTDTSTHAVDDQTDATDTALIPFQQAIDAGANAVMVSSASYPKLDPENIAAFSSKIIQGLLRGTMKFNGMVVSDDLGNAVAVSGYSVADRAVNFINAGGDLLLTVPIENLAPMSAALKAQAAIDPAFDQQLHNAALHVLASKVALGMLQCG